MTNEPLNLLHWKNKGNDQPAHTRGLIQGFVVHILERMTAKLASYKKLKVLLVSVAEQAELSLIYPILNPEDRFSHEAVQIT